MSAAGPAARAAHAALARDKNRTTASENRCQGESVSGTVLLIKRAGVDEAGGFAIDSPLTPSCCVNSGDVDFFHCHHRFKSAFCFCATNSKCLN